MATVFQQPLGMYYDKGPGDFEGRGRGNTRLGGEETQVEFIVRADGHVRIDCLKDLPFYCAFNLPVDWRSNRRAMEGKAEGRTDVGARRANLTYKLDATGQVEVNCSVNECTIRLQLPQEWMEYTTEDENAVDDQDSEEDLEEDVN